MNFLSDDEFSKLRATKLPEYLSEYVKKVVPKTGKHQAFLEMVKGDAALMEANAAMFPKAKEVVSPPVVVKGSRKRENVGESYRYTVQLSGDALRKMMALENSGMSFRSFVIMSLFRQ